MIVPPMELAERELHRLLIEITNVPVIQLAEIGMRLPPSLPGDFVQGKVPVYTQKVLALHEEKSAEAHLAKQKGNMPLYRQKNLEKDFLHELLAFFANTAAPSRLWDRELAWVMCKNFVLVFRPVENTHVPIQPADPKKLN